MLILSIHEGHNASASISYKGNILAAVTEERFSGKKNHIGFPVQAIEYCLTFAQASPDNLDYVAMVTRHIDPLVVNINRSTVFSVQDHIRQQHDFYKRLMRGESQELVRNQYVASCHHDWAPFYDFKAFSFYSTQIEDAEKFFQIRKNAIRSFLEIPETKIVLADHHTAHAAYAYCASPFREEPVLVFTADCIGDGNSATVWAIDPAGHPTLLDQTNNQVLGYIWRYVTLLLGMKQLEHEHKLMGLAPNGLGRHQKAMRVFSSLCNVQSGQWNKAPKFNHYFDVREQLEGYRFDQIAAGLQSHTEAAFCRWIRYWISKTGIHKLVFSGGMSLNVKTNMIIGQLNEVEQFFVAPGGADESLPLGACYMFSPPSNNWRTTAPLTSAYLGPDCLPEDVKWVEKSAQEQSFKLRPGTNQEVITLLNQGKVIGRCFGRMAFGPRALGNRSIIARADLSGMREVLNRKVKKRDWWMPFAPLLLQKNAQKLLEMAPSVDGSFMTTCFNITEMGRKQLGAAIHPVDSTCRPQILKYGINPDLEDFLLAFENQTGILGLLNTSFNLHGFPIVLGPKEAFHTFVNSGLDALWIPNLLILKT